MNKSETTTNRILLSTTRVTRTMFALLGFYALSIVVFDSGNLITREAVINRWTIFTILLFANIIVWAIASQEKFLNVNTYAILGLSVSTVLLAGFMTYWERGMASTSTILYAIPLLVVATLKNRHLLISIGVLSAGTYAFSAVKYFNDYFNEGYRVQLWGNIILYSGVILVATWLLLVVAGLRYDSK